MDSRIKERLTGALILVAALVILVPEIFSGRRAAEPAQEAPLAAPANEGPPLRTYTSELDSASTPAAAATAARADESPPEPVQPPEAAPAPAPAPQPPAAASVPEPAVRPPAPAAAREPARAPPPATAAGGDWFVQVGGFSQAANAQRYAQQLRAQGHAVVIVPPGGGNSLHRVRVGPVRSRAAAAQTLERLKEGGHKGALVGP